MGLALFDRRFMMLYAGIGSRETPPEILHQMTKIAVFMAKKGYTLRSGGAIGADTAFEKGAGSRKEIFRANDATPESFKLAQQYHPAWHRCGEWARKLHARNGLIMLGKNLDTPVDFVVCWTRDGAITGGTGQALRIAAHRRIKVFNLCTEFMAFVDHCRQMP